MVWTLKILTLRPFSTCMVSNQPATVKDWKDDVHLFSATYYPYCVILHITQYGWDICSSLVVFCFLDNADTNGDGFFDEQELEALFTKEVKPWHLKMCNVSVNGLCTDCWCHFSWKKFMTPPMKRMIWWRWRKRGYV